MQSLTNDTRVEVLLRTMALGGRTPDIDDLVLLISEWQPFSNFKKIPTYEELMIPDKCVWERININEIEFTEENNGTNIIINVLSELDKVCPNDDTIHLKVSVFYLIYQAAKFSILNKTAMYSLELIDVLLNRLEDSSDILEYRIIFILIIELSELGLNKTQLQKLLRILKTDKAALQIVYNVLIDDQLINDSIIFDDYEQEMCFPELQLSNSKTAFLISTWLKLRNSIHHGTCDTAEEGFEFLNLTKLDGSPFLSYSIRNSKLYLRTSREDHCFNCFSFEPEELYNISILHIRKGKNIIKIEIYVNNMLVEFKLIPTCLSDDPIQSFFINRSKVILNLKIAGPSRHKNVCTEFAALYLIETENTEKWIDYIYMLGPNYCGNFKDRNINSITSWKNRHLKQRYIGKKNSLYNRKDDNIVFSLNNMKDINKEGIKYLNNGVLLRQTLSPYLKFKKTISIKSSFESLGGAIYCLSQISDCQTQEELTMNTKLLFNILKSSQQLEKEFSEINGYEIISTLITKMKHLITLDLLDIVLNYCGYDSENPEKSILQNKLAYNCLILDFHLWTGKTLDSNQEIIKFLLYHFTVFFQSSKYAKQNLGQLSETKVIKRILFAVKRGLFMEETFPVVVNVLWILSRDNPTSDVLKILQLHSVYMAYTSNGEHDNEPSSGGEISLEVIDKIIEEKPKLLNLMSIKFLLSVLNGSIGMRVLSVKFLLQLLANNNRQYNSFLLFGGFSVISRYLMNDYDEDRIICLVLSKALGFSSLMKFSDLHGTLSNLEKIKIVKPHYFSLLMKLHMYATAVDVNNAKSCKALESFCDIMELIVHRFDFIELFYPHYELVGNLMLLSLLVQRNKAEVCATKYEKLISEALVDGMFADGSEKNYDLLEILYNEYPVEFESILIDLILVKFEKFEHLSSLVLTRKRNVKIISDIIIRYFHYNTKIDVDAVKYLKDFERTKCIIHTIKKCSLEQKSLIPILTTLQREYTKAFYLLVLYLAQPNNNSKLDENTIKMICEVFMSNCDIFDESQEKVDSLVLLVSMLSIAKFAPVKTAYLTCIRTILLGWEDTLSFVNLSSASKDVRDIFSRIMTVSQSQDDDLMFETIVNDEIVAEFCTLTLNDALKKYSKHPLFKLNRESINEYLDKLDTLDKSTDIIENEIKPFGTQIKNLEAKTVTSQIQDEFDDFLTYDNILETLKANIDYDSTSHYNSLCLKEGLNRKRNKLINLVSDEAQQQLETCDLQRQSTHDLQTLKNQNGMYQDNHSTLFSFDEDAFEEDKNRRILRNLFVGDKIDRVFNVTQIVGLDTNESILIVGITHIYLIEGYFYDNGELYYDYQAPESKRDDMVRLLKSVSLNKTENGRTTTTKNRKHKSNIWLINSLVSVSKRKFLLRDVGFELLFKDGSSVLLTCIDTQHRNQIYNRLKGRIVATIEDENLNEALKLSSQQKIKKVVDLRSTESSGFSLVDSFLSSSSDIATSEITKRWCKGEISNFQYLMLLNTVAGRTFNDLTQYPVFPFVLSNYTSETIDLKDPKVYRDLSRPMGAQTPERESLFKERYEATSEMSLDTPPFHYGTHYSSAMIVSSYLIRLNPFTRSYLKLQGGKFDHPDRLFYSVPKLWASAVGDNTTDVRELIPEFYYLPEFLKNKNHIKFGSLQDGSIVDDVELPPWAKGDPVKFVNIMRAALESDYVSERLPEWIDLIFGYKQQGENAINAVNVFHYLSYSGSIDLDSIHDEHEKAVIVSIIHNFGQTPLQIFKKQHPKKDVKATQNMKYLFESLFKMVKNVVVLSDEVIERVEYNKKLNRWMGVQHSKRTLNGSKEKYEMRVDLDGINSITVNEKYTFEELSCGSSISVVEILDKSRILVGFDNGVMRVYEFLNDRLCYVQNSHRSMIKEQLATERQNDPILYNKMTFRDGHTSAILKIKHLPHEQIIFSLDIDRKDIILWYESDKVGDMFLMQKLAVEDDQIADFDVIENRSLVYALTRSGNLYVWRINGDKVLNVEVDKRFTHLALCQNYGTNDYQIGQLLILRGEDKVVLYNVDELSGEIQEVEHLDVGKVNDIGMGFMCDRFEICTVTDSGMVVYK